MSLQLRSLKAIGNLDLNVLKHCTTLVFRELVPSFEGHGVGGHFTQHSHDNIARLLVHRSPRRLLAVYVSSQGPRASMTRQGRRVHSVRAHRTETLIHNHYITLQTPLFESDAAR